MTNAIVNEHDPADGSEELEGLKAVAAAVVAAGGFYTDAGEEVHKSKRTIVRWAAEPEFARLVSDLRAERLSEVTGRLGELAPRALDTIVECLDVFSPFARLRAATAILEWTLRLRRASDLEARLLEIEHRQGIRDSEPRIEGAGPAEVAS